MTDRGRGKRKRAPSSPRERSSSMLRSCLPGYRYDLATNRYYKETDSPSGGSSHVPTSSSSSSNRRTNISSFTCSPKPRRKVPWNAAPSFTHQRNFAERTGVFPFQGLLSELLLKRSLGQIQNRQFERKAHLISVHEQKKKFVSAPCHIGTVSQLQLTEPQDVLLAAVNTGYGANLWKYRLNPCHRFLLHIDRDPDFLYSPSSEITDITVAPVLNIALMCSLGGPGTSGQASALDLTSNRFICSHPVARGNVWSACWLGNTTPPRLVIGASREAYVQTLGETNRTLQTLYTNKSDVMCVRAFARGDTVLTGTRNSALICHDLRSSVPSFTLEHQSSVGDVTVLRNDMGVVVTALNGQVVQWDVRTLRHVIAYEGHTNDYARVKMKVDEKEHLLFIPGNDLFTRIWCLSTGVLLNALPPPHPDAIIANHNVPAVEVGLSWAGHYPGFAIAASGLLHWYAF